MKNVEGNKIIKNHILCDVSDLLPQNTYIYEVIRVIDSCPVFFVEHYNRMIASNYNNSIGSSFAEMKSDIAALVCANNISSCNVKVIYDNFDLYLFFIKSFYPDKKYHEYGADVVTAHIMRENPNVKKFNADYRTKADQLINDNSAYEVLLVNDEGYITEGSKSNVFFFKEKIVYTAPESMVLKGVTRMKIIESIKELGIPIVFQAVKETDISFYDCAFLSGTSIDVFKIRKINDVEFEDNDLIERISLKFLSMVNSE